MSPDDDDLTTPRDKLGEKYAVYHDADNHYWLVDSGVGGTWSPDVEDACWWDSPELAINELRATDILGPNDSPVVAGFFILRVY
jgi:hypothetical protein